MLLLTTAAPSHTQQDLSPAVNTRLDALPALAGEEAAKECGALLKLIEENRTLPPLRRAGGLDRLRDACSRTLPWTAPLLAQIAELAVASRRGLEKEEPAALCKALQELGFMNHASGRLRQAHELYTEALAVARGFRGRGTTDEEVATSLDFLSSLQMDLGQIKEAWESAEQSLRLWRQAVPFRPEKVVTALTTRARVEERQNLKTTRATLLKAYRLSSTLGPEHRAEASRVAHNLGVTLHRLGELTQAVHFLQEAERLRQSDGAGRPARTLASTQLALGMVFFDLGDYPRAIDYHRKAVQGHLEWVGKSPTRYGDALTGLATVLEEAGRWEEALEIQHQALALREAAVGSADRGADAELQLILSRSLTRLGALQQRMGSAEARESLERALAIQDRVLADRADADRAGTLLELAEHWREAGAPERARSAVERCLRELGALGDQGPLLLEALELSARVAADPAVGLRTLAQASRQNDHLFGPDSPRRASLLQVRAELRRRQRDVTGAIADALLAQQLSLPHVRTIVQAFPRDQALVFAADRRQSLDLALHLIAESPKASPGTVEQVWRTAASSRMLVRDAEIDRQRLLRATADPQLTRVAKRLGSARERFAYLLVQTHGTSETQVVRLREARRELLDAEEALASKTRPLLAAVAGDLSVDQLRRRLPSGASLVAIYQYRQPAGSDAYLAFVHHGPEAHAVFLGEAVTIDWLVQQWREALLSPRADAKARLRAGQALRSRIWDPIARLLAGPGTVFVVPDGSLHLVPIFALPAAGGAYLIEQGWTFHSLTAERDLIRQPEPSRPGPWLALGGVDYQRAAAGPGVVAGRAQDVLRGGDEDASPQDSLRGNGCQRGLPSFAMLPASREELQDLDTLWKRLQKHPVRKSLVLTKLSGPEATEQALRRAVPGQRVVHLATHGFAMARRCGPARPAVRGIGGLSLGSGIDTTGPRPLAGLVLAGANERGKALRSDQDGILTEDEILGLDLRAADWVVLSACETGLGEIRPGEGVVGMLRAFQVAGAKTIIVSLWSVRDQAAREWMRELYQARFERRLSTLEAIRQAALHRLRFYRQQGDDNPANWAGFVASGQWQ